MEGFRLPTKRLDDRRWDGPQSSKAASILRPAFEILHITEATGNGDDILRRGPTIIDARLAPYIGRQQRLHPAHFASENQKTSDISAPPHRGTESRSDRKGNTVTGSGPWIRSACAKSRFCPLLPTLTFAFGRDGPRTARAVRCHRAGCLGIRCVERTDQNDTRALTLKSRPASAAKSLRKLAWRRALTSKMLLAETVMLVGLS